MKSIRSWKRLAGAAALATVLLAASASGIAVAAGTVTTLAGTGAHGSQNGPGNTATFKFPQSVATDSMGNIFVAEYGAHLIRKITPAGVVSTFAGTGAQGYVDGPGNTAQFSAPKFVAVDGADNVFVIDAVNNRIRKITPAGVVSTFAGSGSAGGADGNGTAASFAGPLGLAADSAGYVYVADTQNHRIRKITPAGVVSTLAGSLTGATGHVNGSGAAARFNNPQGVAVDGSGNVYVGDTYNYAVRKISPTGTVSTLAGSLTGVAGQADGLGSAAEFSIPWGMTLDSTDNLYVADNGRIRKITPLGQVTTVAGSSVGFLDGPALSAQFLTLSSIAIYRPGNIVYVADYGNDRIRTFALEAAVQQNQNEYAAKVICGVSAPTTAIPVPPVARGAYFTALNVRNAAGQVNDLKWKIAIALPGEKPGPVSQFFIPGPLQPDQALEIDCPDIAKRIGKKADEFVKGFVVVQSNLELDVVAVYTTAAMLTGTVSSIEIERVPRRTK